MPGAPGRRGPPDSSRLTSGLAEVSSFRHDKQQDSAIAVFKPGDDVVVDVDLLLAPIELSEAEALAAQRCGHLLANARAGVLAEPGDQVIVDADRLLAPVELSEADALVAQRAGHLLAHRW